jgi:hypothetical protein
MSDKDILSLQKQIECYANRLDIAQHTIASQAREIEVLRGALMDIIDVYETPEYFSDAAYKSLRNIGNAINKARAVLDGQKE